MKKRLMKKMENAQNLMGKRLSGRYAQTVARRIDVYGNYDFWVCSTPKTNFGGKYYIFPCITFNGDAEIENGFFRLRKVGDVK